MKKIKLFAFIVISLFCLSNLVLAEEIFIQNTLTMKTLSVDLTTDGQVAFYGVGTGETLSLCSAEDDEIVENTSVGNVISLQMKAGWLDDGQGNFLELIAGAPTSNTYDLKVLQGFSENPSCPLIMGLTTEFQNVNGLTYAEGETASFSYEILLSDVIQNQGVYTGETSILAIAI